MMKILVLDYLFAEGHRDFNSNVIDCLSSMGEVKVISKESYYSGYRERWKNVELEESIALTDRGSAVMRKIQCISLMIKTAKEVNNSSYDLVVVLAFDTLAMALSKLFLNTERMFIIHHKNIDELCQTSKKMAFKFYMNKVHHIVFEGFFKDYLVNELGVENGRVHVIPHPISKGTQKETCQKPLYNCVGLSNSNDEEFIKEIIDKEETYGLIKKAKLHIVLRSKKYKFDNGNLKVVSGCLLKEEYDNYIENCKCFFISLPGTYRYRVSGAIFDAFSNHKIVLASGAPIIESYQLEYPNICIEISSVEEFVNRTARIANSKETKRDFEKFLYNHDKMRVISRLKDELVKMK